MSKKHTPSCKIHELAFWQKAAAEKIKEEFGEKVYIGRNDSNSMGAIGQIIIVQIIGFNDYICFGRGKTAREALVNAGLEKWVESVELNERAKK